MDRRAGVTAAVLLALAALLPAGAASGQSVAWTRQFGTQFSDDAEGVAVHTDGGTWVTGQTFGTLPGQTPAGMIDAFVRRYDPAGQEIWTRQFGSSERDYARAVTVDGAGNSFVVGQTFGSLPGQTSAGGYDAFVRKYDPDGTELWTRQFGSGSGDGALGVAVDPAGNAYVTGSTKAADPGKSSIGDYDAFLRKYDPAGQEVLNLQFGSTLDDFATAVAVDPDGGAVVVGETAGQMPNASPAGGPDAFVRRFDAAGNEAWIRQFGSPANDRASGVALDGDRNVYVVGRADGAMPGGMWAGDGDAFTRKYDAAGAEAWTHQFGTPAFDDASGVAVDATGASYTVGRTGGTLPGHRSAGGIDAYVRKLDPSGIPAWTLQLGSSDVDYALAVAVDGAGVPCIAGGTRGALSGQSSAGDRDAFVLRLG